MIVHSFKLGKTSLFGAVIELDGVSFSNVMQKSKLRIGWDICSIYESFDVKRCFNCLAYHHTASNCTEAVCCSKCSGTHKWTECKSQTECCINCKTAASNLNMSLDTVHSALSVDCVVYKRKIEMERRRIDYSVE